MAAIVQTILFLGTKHSSLIPISPKFVRKSPIDTKQ